MHSKISELHVSIFVPVFSVVFVRVKAASRPSELRPLPRKDVARFAASSSERSLSCRSISRITSFNSFPNMDAVMKDFNAWAEMAVPKEDEEHQPVSKKQRQDKMDQDVDQVKDQLLLAVARLTCKLEEQVRIHDYLLLRSFSIPRKCEYSTKGKATLQAYSKKTKGKRGHQEGRPEQHLTVSVVHTTAKMAAAAQDQDSLQILIEFSKAFKHPKEIQRQDMQYMRIMDCYDEQKRRILISPGVTPLSVKVTDIIVKYLKVVGEEQEGVAPKGGVARKIQALLEEAQKMTKQ